MCTSMWKALASLFLRQNNAKKSKACNCKLMGKYDSIIHIAYYITEFIAFHHFHFCVYFRLEILLNFLVLPVGEN